MSFWNQSNHNSYWNKENVEGRLREQKVEDNEGKDIEEQKGKSYMYKLEYDLIILIHSSQSRIFNL